MNKQPPPEDRRFQVDLSGVITLLSQHLYSHPGVFLREQLQNAVDAVQARRQLDPTHAGSIQIDLVERDGQPPTLVFLDDGIGLTEEEIHEFLATIGQSSKRSELVERQLDFIGQFGIGLLSGFMVTDEIVVVTRSSREGDHPAVQWTGKVNGTYEVNILDSEVPVGTQVFLRAKPGAEEFFEGETVLQQLEHFGAFLEPVITFSHDDASRRVNQTPPWETAQQGDRQLLREYGEGVFDRRFLDVIPLSSQAGGVAGLAFVLSDPTHAGARQQHRVYLKKMLLSTTMNDLLPDWAFFVQCMVNATELRPTASRESFYEDDQLEAARDELGRCLRSYLVDMARHEPGRFQHFISVHRLALKALAVDDDECLELFADWLPFETTVGTMSLGEFIEQNKSVRYVPTRDQFLQISQVAASESLAVINAGYVYDVEILERLGALRPNLDVEPFEVEDLSERFEELAREERDGTVEFERVADAALQPYKCAVELSKFKPLELPALFVTNANADFLRSVEQSREVADDVWSGVLDNLADDVVSVYARLHLNYSNALVQRVSSLPNREAQRRCVEMLYVQALLLGHYPLKQKETRLLNQGLLGLINWALDSAELNRDE